MSRGLGTRQRMALEALQTLERERGPGWRTVGDVVSAIDGITGVGRNSALEHIERADRMQLEHAREMVARGVYSFRQAVYAIEARVREREAWKRREAAMRYPNTLRRGPRAGEDGNPSRVLQALARRGLIERRAHCGPGSAVRLVAGFVSP